MECYGCSSCANLPVSNSSSAFTGMSLTGQNGAPIVPVWAANPVPAQDRTCNESIAIFNAASISIYPGTS